MVEGFLPGFSKLSQTSSSPLNLFGPEVRGSMRIHLVKMYIWKCFSIHSFEVLLLPLPTQKDNHNLSAVFIEVCPEMVGSR